MPRWRQRSRKVRPVTRLRSEDGERAYWAKHEVADHFDWARVVTLANLKPSTSTISIRLPSRCWTSSRYWPTNATSRTSR